MRDLVEADKAIVKIKSQRNFMRITARRNPALSFGSIQGASFCNLNDRTHSAEPAILLIRNKKNETAPIMWYAKKIKRACSSTLGPELTALVEGMGQAVHLKQVLEDVYELAENTIPIHAITDHKSLYQAVHSTTAINTRRLRREMAKVIDQFRLKEVETP